MSEIPEIPLVMSPQTAEARAVIGFRWNKSVGRRHKLGGSPDWIQSDKTPECHSCFARMTFYAQLDSIGDEFALGDCGMMYIFICFECGETKMVVQCS